VVLALDEIKSSFLAKMAGERVIVTDIHDLEPKFSRNVYFLVKLEDPFFPEPPFRQLFSGYNFLGVLITREGVLIAGTDRFRHCDRRKI
jgi:hypothetical protein